MPDFTIETTYHLPVFRQRRYTADSLDDACDAAIADDNWVASEQDHDASGEVYVSAAWEGVGAAHGGMPIAVPGQFDEMVQRRARHFEILLGLLKILATDAQTSGVALDWQAHAAFEIARGQAILDRAPDPEMPMALESISHTLIRLQEKKVRSAIASILAVDPTFSTLTLDDISRDDIHTACIAIATTLDLSDVASNAEFQAALAAIRSAQTRLQPD